MVELEASFIKSSMNKCEIKTVKNKEVESIEMTHSDVSYGKSLNELD